MTFAPLPSTPATAVPADAPLLDVREPDEWAAGHADGATHVPMSQVVARLEEITGLAARHDGPLYVICKVGGRSAQVAQYLAQRGLDVVNVDGGMLAWEAAGRPMAAEAPGVEPHVL
ncbi:rhodanese-like domain-containing protein [Streptomyces sp. RFCAC02]|uniref:rhodanese-like domain-containing protein n=1 Tax=Streptomyces sp. RFCAC02 TaxID=2499143 RepID=UPI001020F345|nr:rhodanese-like domain-containing protein [Streptomyces sp. RFCAC02]